MIKKLFAAVFLAALFYFLVLDWTENDDYATYAAIVIAIVVILPDFITKIAVLIFINYVMFSSSHFMADENSSIWLVIVNAIAVGMLFFRGRFTGHVPPSGSMCLSCFGSGSGRTTWGTFKNPDVTTTCYACGGRGTNI